MISFNKIIVKVLEELVIQLLNNKNLDAEKLKDAQRFFAKKNNLDTLPSKSQILQTYFELVKK
jgi:histone acetyltransferase (RNA polymerase elongator complex component)